MDDPAIKSARFRLCPHCARAVPAHSSERYCINDGTWLLEACPVCAAPISSPYARYCGTCGLEFVTLGPQKNSIQNS